MCLPRFKLFHNRKTPANPPLHHLILTLGGREMGLRSAKHLKEGLLNSAKHLNARLQSKNLKT